MYCPDCGYSLSAFDKDCPRCARLRAWQKGCPHCGTATPLDTPKCGKCGHVFSMSFAQEAAARRDGTWEPLVASPTPLPPPAVSIGESIFSPSESAAVASGRRTGRSKVAISAIALVLIVVVASALYQILGFPGLGSAGSGVQNGLPFLPQSLQKPAVVSFAAVTTESKASYSDTTFEEVTRFRIVQPGDIERNAGDGWKPYLPPPNGEQPIALGAARTMEKASYSDTTWIKIHVVLLTKTGNLYDSEDGSAWQLYLPSDGKPAVGLAATSYAEKTAYSDTTWWHLEVLRLLADGSIESTEGNSWKLFAPADGKRVLSISAAATKEKQSYSDTTWWRVNVFRLLDNGEVEESEDGALWKPYGTQRGAVSLAAYNVEEKASYSNTTFENLLVDYAAPDPAEAVIQSDQEPPVPPAPVAPALAPSASAPTPMTAPTQDNRPAPPPPAFEMKTKAGGGTPPDLSRFKHQ